MKDNNGWLEWEWEPWLLKCGIPDEKDIPKDMKKLYDMTPPDDFFDKILQDYMITVPPFHPDIGPLNTSWKNICTNPDRASTQWASANNVAANLLAIKESLEKTKPRFDVVVMMESLWPFFLLKFEKTYDKLTDSIVGMPVYVCKTPEELTELVHTLESRKKKILFVRDENDKTHYGERIDRVCRLHSAWCELQRELRSGSSETD